jgi:ATP-dependent DNA ligase
MASGSQIGALCRGMHQAQGEVAVRRIMGVLSLGKKYGVARVDDACAIALEVGVCDYPFVRRYLERNPQLPLNLRQIDPLIRQLTLYRDLVATRKTKAAFIEPMLLLRTGELPEGDSWLYEIKFDGYRAIAFKTGGRVHLRSRNDNDFNARYPAIVNALADMPDETVIDGEVVALDAAGKPSFNTLQNHGSAGAPLHFYIFDLMVLAGRDVTMDALEKRRELLEYRVLPKLAEPIRYSPIESRIIE